MCVLWHLFGMHRPTTTTYLSPRTGVCGGLFPHKITVLVVGLGRGGITVIIACGRNLHA